VRTKSLIFGMLAFFMSVAVSAAQEAKPASSEVNASTTPHQVVEGVTSELMKVVASGKQALKDDPDKYFADIQVVMQKAVDFKYIARSVMGKKYWKSSSDVQKQKFVDIFTSGLVQTYAKGMANFADYEISVMPPQEDIGDKRKVEVVQKFKGPQGVNRVAYTMGKHKSGDWKLLNVTLDGVNLGKTLRSQFTQSVNENQGDLDAAIAGWTL